MSRTFAIRALLTAAALAFGGAAFALVWVAQFDTLVASETEFDAGNRPPGAAVTHTFVLANRSLGPIRITSVTPACTCDTQAEAPLGEVSRLGQTDLTVRWRAPQRAGEAKTQVTVGYVIDDVPGTLVLTVRCVVSGAESPPQNRN